MRKVYLLLLPLLLLSLQGEFITIVHAWTLIMNRRTAYPNISIQRLKATIWGISGFVTVFQNPKFPVGPTRNWVASTFGTQQTLLEPHTLLSDHIFIYGYSVAFSRLWTWTLLCEIFISSTMKLVWGMRSVCCVPKVEATQFRVVPTSILGFWL